MAKQSDYFNQTPYMFRNKIMNGAMEVAQRDGIGPVSVRGFSSSIFSWRVTPDRWLTVVFGTALSGTIQQTLDVPANTEFKNSYLYTSSTAVTAAQNIGVTQQTLEGYDIIDLAYGTNSAKNIVLSFWVKSSRTGTFSGSWRAHSSTQGTWSYVFTYTINSANTWEKKTITIPGNTQISNIRTDNSSGASLIFSFGTIESSLVTSTTNQWLNADYHGTLASVKITQVVGATFYLTGVQLEIGNKATEFEYQPYDYVLKLCQRYYTKPMLQNQVNSSGNCIGFVYGFPTPMRTDTPVISCSNADLVNVNFTRNKYACTFGYWWYGLNLQTLSAADAEFVPWVVPG